MASKYFIYFLTICFSSNCFAIQEQYYYRVRLHESASEILNRVGLRPIYGTDGVLQSLTQSNPQVTNINRIYPNQKLIFNKSLVDRALAKGRITVAADGEILFAATSAPLAQHSPTHAGEKRNIATETLVQTEASQTSQVIVVEAPVAAPAPTPMPTPVADTKPSPPKPTPIAEIAPSPTPAPLVETKPVPQPIPAPAIAFQQYGRFGVGFGIDYSRIDSTDTRTRATSVFLSESSPRIDFNWDFAWSRDWSSFTRAVFIYETIGEDTAANALTIQNASGFRKTFELGGKRHWTGEDATSLSFGVRDLTYSHAPSLTTLSMDRIPTPFIRIGHEFAILRLDRGSMFLGAHGDYLFGSKHSVHTTQPGWAGEVSFGVRNEFTNFLVETKAYYGFTRQNSNIVEQTESDLGGRIQFVWKVGP